MYLLELVINVQNCSHCWQKRADQCYRRKYNLGHQQDLLNFSKKIYLENQPDIITKYENKINENKKFSNRYKYVYEHDNICMFHQAVISKCRDQWNSSRNIYPHFILRTIILIQKYNFIAWILYELPHWILPWCSIDYRFTYILFLPFKK